MRDELREVKEIFDKLAKLKGDDNMKNKLEKYFKGEYEQYKEESKYEIMSYDQWFECIKGLDYYKKEINEWNKLNN